MKSFADMNGARSERDCVPRSGISRSSFASTGGGKFEGVLMFGHCCGWSATQPRSDRILKQLWIE